MYVTLPSTVSSSSLYCCFIRFLVVCKILAFDFFSVLCALVRRLCEAAIYAPVSACVCFLLSVHACGFEFDSNWNREGGWRKTLTHARTETRKKRERERASFFCETVAFQKYSNNFYCIGFFKFSGEISKRKKTSNWNERTGNKMPNVWI